MYDASKVQFIEHGINMQVGNSFDWLQGVDARKHSSNNLPREGGIVNIQFQDMVSKVREVTAPQLRVFLYCLKAHTHYIILAAILKGRDQEMIAYTVSPSVVLG